MDFASARAAAASGFQPAQQPPFINPVWFMQRNGLMNGLADPTAAAAAGGFSYPSYPSLINHSPIGFPYPTAAGYFADPTIPNLESFNLGMHHQLPSAPSSSGPAPGASMAAPTSSSFPAVFSPAAHQQNTFLAWKYC